jgi:hypothetical protein
MDLQPSYTTASKFPLIPKADSPIKAPHRGMIFMGAPPLSTDSPDFLEFKQSGLQKVVISSDPVSITRSLDKPIETAAQIATESNPSNCQIIDHPKTLTTAPDQSGEPPQIIPRSRNWQQAIAASHLPVEEIRTVVLQIRRLQERKTETKKAFEAEMVYATQLIADYWVMMGRFGYVWDCPILVPPYRSCDEISAAAAKNNETRNQLKWEWKVLLEEEERLLGK